MSRTECIRRLIQWCLEHRSFEKLLAHARDLNGMVYGQLVNRCDSHDHDHGSAKIAMPTSTTAILLSHLTHGLVISDLPLCFGGLCRVRTTWLRGCYHCGLTHVPER